MIFLESLKLSFEAIAPIFLLMLLGYFLKRINFADKKSFNAINKMVFNIFLPVLLFYNIYDTEQAEVFSLPLVVFTVIGVLCIFVIGYFSVFLLSHDNSKRGVMLQGFFRGNFAILGIPLAEYICGENSGGLTSLMVAVVVPLFNVLSVIALERFRGEKKKPNIAKMIFGIIKNPLIIGCIAGILFFVLKIKLPFVIEKSVKDISSVATPLAIIMLGSGFEFGGVKSCLREIIIVVSSRLVLIPAAVIPFAVYFGFRGEAMACLLITFAAPIAVSSFSMSQQMGGDEQLSAQIIVISSAACLVTLFLWIFILGNMGLF